MADDEEMLGMMQFNSDFNADLDCNALSGEFLFDSDESSPLPIPDNYDVGVLPSDFGSGLPADFMDQASPSIAFAVEGQETRPQSGNNSSGDSLSSSSSKRGRSMSSAKTSFLGGDMAMQDGPDVKSEWFTDRVTTMRDCLPLTPPNDGTINPSSISSMDGMSGFGEHQQPSYNNSPSPCSGGREDAGINPQNTQNIRPRNMASPDSPFEFGNSEGNYHSFSLPHMLKVDTSRDASRYSPAMASNVWQPHSPAQPQPDITQSLGGWVTAGTGGEQVFGMANGIPAAVMNPLFAPNPTFGQPRLHVHIKHTKSRVETQIPITLSVAFLPEGVKKLRLPPHTLSKPKLVAKPPPQPSPDMVELHTVLVCTSAMSKPNLKEEAMKRAFQAAMRARSAMPTPGEDADDEETKPQDGGEVRICNGCMERERKRSGRKKVKKPEDEQAWIHDARRRAIVFNTQEVKLWQLPGPDEPGRAVHRLDLPMRIACYCRHHTEKMGFQVIFTITDCRSQVIAQEMSKSIMITDDHKTTPPGTTPHVSETGMPLQVAIPASTPSPSQNQGPDFQGPSPSRPSFDQQPLRRISVQSPGTPTAQSQPTTAAQTPRALSRPGSPSGALGPYTKKRKSSSSAKVPSALAMTPLEEAPTPNSQLANLAMGSANPSPTPPFSCTPPPYIGVAEQSFSNPGTAGSGTSMGMGFSSSPPILGSGDHLMSVGVNRVPGMDVLNMPMYSAPGSRYQSRAPSPSSLRPAPGPQTSGQMAQATALANLFGVSPSTTSAPPPPPVIHKIIPAEGPVAGGIEVTVLGSGFFNGVEVMFGDYKATTTTFWGPTSLVCLLPPAAMAGIVHVTFKHQTAHSSQQAPRDFKYVDDGEYQLLRTALMILGNKMNGEYKDVRDIAKRILDNSKGWDSSSGGELSGGVPFNNLALNMSFEAQMLKLLELIDLDDSPHKPRLNLRRSTGQTMLHLACSLGLHRFAAGLLARGANVDLRDKGGYTALHMAALNGHLEIVRRLVSCGADPSLRTLSGLSPVELAPGTEIAEFLCRVDRHARSRSGELPRSKASSSASLKSLWEPLSRLSTTRGASGDDEESLEYSSLCESEGEAADDDEPDAWLDMQRRNVREMPAQEPRPDRLEQPGTDAAAVAGLPSAAMAAFKEQFTAQLQQFQHQMAVLFPNLPQLRQFPQFPNLPQMPNMPLLPDYQAAVLQRLSAMMPAIGGPRPGSSGEHPPAAKELDSRWWWDLPSLVAGSPPPPSYEDIYPHDAADTKQASAARAAIEAEGDAKAAALFDNHSQQQEEDSESGSSESRLSLSLSASSEDDAVAEELPALLQIGRKNAITKEQRENWRRAHAERLKRLSRDRNLFFIWIPLLVAVLFAMFYSRVPGLLSTAKDSFPGILRNAQQELQQLAAPVVGAGAREVVQGRVVEEVF